MRPQKRERLHGFPKAHLIGENAAEIIRGETCKPLEARYLIFAQLLCERAEFAFCITDRSCRLGDESLQRLASIGDGRAELARRFLDVRRVRAVDAVKAWLRL